MKKLIRISVLSFSMIVLLANCATLKMSKTQDFALNKSTRVGIQYSIRTVIPIGSLLEGAFLSKGFNVSPAEVMLDKNYTDYSIDNNDNSTIGSIASYRGRYIPAAILITVSQSGTSAFIIKIIDLRDQRLLFTKRYVYWTTVQKVTNKFMKDISPFIEIEKKQSGEILDYLNNYSYIKDKLKYDGYTIIENPSFDLRQGESASYTKTFTKNVKYRIICFSKDDNVSGIGAHLERKDGTIDIKSENSGKISKIDYTPEVNTEMIVVVKNYSSHTPYDKSKCRIVIAYKL